jgi:hypothetical protein
MRSSILSRLAVVFYKQSGTSSIAAEQESPDMFLHVFNRSLIGSAKYYAFTERGNRVSNPWVRSVWIALAIIFGKLGANHRCATSELPALTVRSCAGPSTHPLRLFIEWLYTYESNICSSSMNSSSHSFPSYLISLLPNVL